VTGTEALSARREQLLSAFGRDADLQPPADLPSLLLSEARKRLVAGARDREDERFTVNVAGTAMRDKLAHQRGLAEMATAIVTECERAEDGAIERDAIGLVAEHVERRMLLAT
jgi:hypothetical protein